MLNSGRAQGGSGEWEQPFWQQRGWILSAGFLVVLLVLAVLFAVTGDGGARGRRDRRSEAGADLDRRRQPGGEGGSDARPAGLPHRRPRPGQAHRGHRATSDWKADGTGLVPVSKAAGPLKYDGPVWSCFAHTPMGAVMAAHSITDHLSYDGWRKVVEQQVVPGTGRDALIASRSQEADKSPRARRTPAATPASLSCRTTRRRDRDGPGPWHGRRRLRLRLGNRGWHDGDWKLAPDPDGTIYTGVAQVSGTDGFVTWEA